MLQKHTKPLGVLATLALCLTATTGCAQPAPTGVPALTGVPSPAEGWRAVTVTEGIRNPWGIAWLKDGRPIITAKRGTLHVLTDGKI